eukprot:361266-Chlamydomonas_euryale.AAC.4
MPRMSVPVRATTGAMHVHIHSFVVRRRQVAAPGRLAHHAHDGRCAVAHQPRVWPLAQHQGSQQRGRDGAAYAYHRGRGRDASAAAAAAAAAARRLRWRRGHARVVRVSRSRGLTAPKQGRAGRCRTCPGQQGTPEQQCLPNRPACLPACLPARTICPPHRATDDWHDRADQSRRNVEALLRGACVVADGSLVGRSAWADMRVAPRSSASGLRGRGSCSLRALARPTCSGFSARANHQSVV